ncbi:hypothetical protein [Comamonas sp. NoAH]|uniref:hypothetical protein n=1 Tax=Comamonas halotolerans TaxID=3041496 RepID=UPI0024E0D6DD|nr:hypothetical protein [Comamonas sp. NoAH]
MTDQKTMFARATIGGKKTEKLEARVSDELKEAVRRRWKDDGFGSESEWLEHVIAIACFGFEHVRMVQEQRLRRVSFVSDIVQPNPSGKEVD